MPIVFATHPLLECVSKSDKIFHIVFFIVLTSVILQGTTLSPIAKWLGLEESSSQKNVRAIDLADELNTELFELIIPANSLVDGRKIVEIDFPKHALIVLINRDKGYLTPRGDTEPRSGDKLMIMAEDKNLIKEVKDCLEIA